MSGKTAVNVFLDGLGVDLKSLAFAYQCFEQPVEFFGAFLISDEIVLVVRISVDVVIVCRNLKVAAFLAHFSHRADIFTVQFFCGELIALAVNIEVLASEQVYA